MVYSGFEAINKTLVFVGLVARHGVRSPYPPFGESECNTYTKYSARSFPTIEDWGMNKTAFCEQQLTPHGIKSATREGEYFKDTVEVSESTADFDYSCDTIAVVSDNSTRDIQTATQFIKGFGCEGETNIVVAGANNFSTTLWPTVNDAQNQLSCPTTTEDEFLNLFGNNPQLLTDSFYDGIEKISDLLEMKSYNATICMESNPNYDESVDGPCTMFQTGFEYTGRYYQGFATAAYNRAGFFAELFMLQYSSGLDNWAFGEMTYDELEPLFDMHVQNQIYGSSIWNSLTFGSQLVGYLLASIEQVITGEAVAGVEQSITDNILYLQGHDFNLMYVQKILSLDYIFNEAKAVRNVLFSTTGTIRFDLLRDDDTIDEGHDEFYVRATYTVPSPTQQRMNEALSVDNPPQIAVMSSPYCDGKVICPYSEFKKMVLNHISIDCIQEPLRSSLVEMKHDGNESDDIEEKPSGDDDKDESEDGCLSISEFACNDENFSSFCIFFDVYSAENDLGNALTFFLPTNDAFEAMDKNFDKLTFEENESVLSYHIINEIVHFDELICKGLIVTANGKESRTKCIGDDKYQRGQNQMDNMLPKIIIHDVQVCNGIVHVVDHVLMPKLEK